MKKGKATNKAEAEEDENWSRGRDDPGWESGVTEPTKERGRHHWMISWVISENKVNVNVKPEQMDMMRKQTAMCFTFRASSCCGLVFDQRRIFSFVCLLSSSIVLFINMVFHYVNLFHLQEGGQGGFKGANGVSSNCASGQAHLQVEKGVSLDPI